MVEETGELDRLSLTVSRCGRITEFLRLAVYVRTEIQNNALNRNIIYTNKN